MHAIRLNFLTLTAALFLFGCGGESVKISEEDQKKIDETVLAIKSEPRVKDFLYEQLGSHGQWNIGIFPKKGRDEYGFANYICAVIADYGIDLDKQFVRIVDMVKLVREQIPPKKASLIRVQCSSTPGVGARLYPE